MSEKIQPRLAKLIFPKAKGTILLLATLVGQTPLTAAPPPGMVVERIIGTEIDTGRYKHPSCVTELDNGDLYLTYYGCDGDYSQDTAVLASLLAS